MAARHLAHDQQRIGAIELRVERRAQGAGRKDATIADAAAAVDDRDGQVLHQRRILQAVIHDDDAGALRFRQRRAGDAVARNDRGRHARQQQRLVADLRGVIGMGVHKLRAGGAAAIAAAETKHPLAAFDEHFGERHDQGRLAGAAEGEISHAQHGHARARAGTR